MNAPAYTITQDALSVVWEGKPVIVLKGAVNFLLLRKALLDESWEDVAKHLTPAKSLTEWTKGKFRVEGETVFYGDTALPSDMNKWLFIRAAEGGDPTPLFKFWEKLQQNPSMRSVQQLWGFLQHQGIPLTTDGCFLAYKSVDSDYMDNYSRKFNNSPGAVHEMPRNQISDDPQQACHTGFHVGALEYARTFGNDNRRIVVCKVDPADVVCVPYDESQRKMRVCKYVVQGNYGAELPSTTFEEEDEKWHSSETTMADVEKKKKVVFIHELDLASFTKYDMAALLKLSIRDLRRYATKELKIVGAGHIPGGKVALVNRIIEVRGA